jgi:HEAT repeat protein
MAVAELAELTADVNRLLAAGSAAAAQDAGLRRHARGLRKLAGQAPALRPLADQLERIETGRSGAAALLDLLVMTFRLRAGLTVTGGAGPVAPLPESGPWSTPASIAELSPVVRWLRRPAWEEDWDDVENFFRRHADLRLVGPFLKRMAQGTGDPADSVAAELLPCYGPALLPELRCHLENDDRRTWPRALMAICHIDGPLGAALCRPRLTDQDINVRCEALRCLAVAEPDEARQTGLAWLEGRTTRGLRYSVWSCLGDLTPFPAHHLPALLRALPQGTDYGAAEVVASVGRAAVRPLTELLRSQGADTRACAAAALGCLGKRAAPAVPALFALLDDPAERVVATVIRALPKIGEAARPAVPRLIELMGYGKSDYHVPLEAAYALVKLGRDDPAAVAALIARLDGKHWQDWHPALDHVTELGPAAKAAVPRLMTLYRDRRSHWQFRRDILEALAAIGPAARAARPLLEQALRDREVRVRYAAAVALGMLGPVGKAAVPVLLAAMHDHRESWWWTMYAMEALRAFGSLGPAAAVAVPDLTEAARTEEDAERRRAIREALKQIRASGADDVP